MSNKSSAQSFFPDAWQRFERALDIVAKSPPQHRKAKPTTKRQKQTKKLKVSRASRAPA
jgi:hypothetical protein